MIDKDDGTQASPATSTDDLVRAAAKTGLTLQEFQRAVTNLSQVEFPFDPGPEGNLQCLKFCIARAGRVESNSGPKWRKPPRSKRKFAKGGNHNNHPATRARLAKLQRRKGRAEKVAEAELISLEKD